VTPERAKLAPFGRKINPCRELTQAPLIVALVQSLAWAVKVDDAASVRMSKSGIRDFIDASVEFVLMSSCLECSRLEV
jgi:hypothetical protein